MTVMLLFTACMTAAAQGEITSEENEETTDSPVFVPMVKVGKALVDNDSIQYVELNTLYVYPKLTFKDERQRQAYNRLVANIKKVLPIAKEVNSIIVETYEYLQTPRMKKLTYSQGKLLIKLVYRECNSSSYQLIQAFLGPIRAGFYQAFASLFGASLTKKYDPEGVDKYTERIVRQVEAGQI